MCLAIPGRIEEMHGEGLDAVGRVSFGGVVREVSLAFLSEARVGDYVVVHVGVALSVLDPEEAALTLQAIAEAADP
jgi:hydrogenase expression/formation protein HypC